MSNNYIKGPRCPIARNIKSSLLLIDSDGEFSEYWDGINYQLFRERDDWKPLSVVGMKDGFAVEVADAIPYGLFGARLMIPLRIINLKTGVCAHTPFYRSTGSNHPGKSPDGTWWPTAGIYTKAYCDARVRADGTKIEDPKALGWISKAQFKPNTGRWLYHDKDVSKLSKAMRDIQSALSAYYVAT